MTPVRRRLAFSDARHTADRPSPVSRHSANRSLSPPSEPGVVLEGHLRLLLAYDVAEAIDLDALSELLGPKARRAKLYNATFTTQCEFGCAPLLRDLQDSLLSNDGDATFVARYYSLGVVVLQIETAFCTDWSELAEQVGHLDRLPEKGEPHLKNLLAVLIREAGSTIHRPTSSHLHERYLIVSLASARDSCGHAILPEDLKSHHGHQIARLVRNEHRALSQEETAEILENSLAYYKTDLTVITSSAAFVYDRPEEALSESYVLEYAKVQLLEYRHYDALLARVLDDIYRALERQRSPLLARWTLPHEANKYNRIRAEIMQVRERIDSAIKFVGDVFYARVFRAAAESMGMPQYRAALDDKLHTLGELYGFMIDQFNEARTFVLEFAAAILALLGVLFLIRGK